MGCAEKLADVAIIGAGPAGSTAAIALARAGRRVMLIEKRQFPRDKVCGGCLSGSATNRLRKLLGEDRSLPGFPTKRITFVIGSYRLCCHPNGATQIVPRRELDACLADMAASAGAEVRYGTAAKLERGNGRWDVLIGPLRVRADTVLAAGGMGGMPRQLGIHGRSTNAAMIAQQWIQPADPPLPQLGCIELHWLRKGYVGLATPEEGRCVVAMAADSSGDRGESAYSRLRRLNPDAAIWSMLPSDAPRRYNAKGSAGFPWIPDRLGRDNVLLIGDEAGYEEPFTGEGMGQAMCSAACAVQAVVEGGGILRRYGLLMRRHHRPVIRRTRLISRVLSTSLLHFVASRRPVLPHHLLAGIVERVHIRGGQ